eukprot:TRINITY_DN5828_c0_g2_i1.p1 TRINITY_DN5828_c0_g2~~TRINITY_DN5828_c0_g2_i1.p1  ORF type:complete len:249 (-),score=39.26 TRINITY_DN5828_c0_g2_i1:116-862(-)
MATSGSMDWLLKMTKAILDNTIANASLMNSEDGEIITKEVKRIEQLGFKILYYPQRDLYSVTYCKDELLTIQSPSTLKEAKMMWNTFPSGDSTQLCWRIRRAIQSRMNPNLKTVVEFHNIGAAQPEEVKKCVNDFGGKPSFRSRKIHHGCEKIIAYRVKYQLEQFQLGGTKSWWTFLVSDSNSGTQWRMKLQKLSLLYCLVTQNVYLSYTYCFFKEHEADLHIPVHCWKLMSGESIEKKRKRKEKGTK